MKKKIIVGVITLMALAGMFTNYNAEEISLASSNKGIVPDSGGNDLASSDKGIVSDSIGSYLASSNKGIVSDSDDNEV